MNPMRRMEMMMTALALGVILMAALVSYGLLSDKKELLERALLMHQGKTFARLLERELDALEKTNRDYAVWDDTLGYYRHGSVKFEKDNLNAEAFANLNISLMLFLDEAGQVRHGFSAAGSPVAPETARRFAADYGALAAAGQKPLRGVVRVQGEPALVTAVPISDTAETEREGVLVMTRPLAGSLMDHIQAVLECQTDLEGPLTDSSHDPLPYDRFGPISIGDYRTGEQVISAHLNLMDLKGRPVAGILLSQTSQVWGLSREVLRMVVTVTFVAIAAITLLQAWLNRAFILGPVRTLGDYLNSRGQDRQLRDYAAIPEMYLLNEDATILGRIHGMLRRIAEDAAQLQRDRLSTRLALESSMAGTWEYDRQQDRLRCDAQTLSLLGAEADAFPMSREQLEQWLHPEEQEPFSGLFTRSRDDGERGFQMECRIRHGAGGYRWYLLKGDSLEWDEAGNGVLFSGILLDIDAKKRMESELRYLSYHDKLTGLYNRRYFEEQLLALDQPGCLPTAIFVADINGLKLANDTFGHERGDQLLRQAAESLREAVGPEAVVSRWGGDEFAVLLPHTDETQAEAVLERIKARCRDREAQGLGLHLAVGHAVKKSGALTLQHLVHAAEESMYRDKMLESRGAHADFLARFRLQLHEKGIETFEHCQRAAALGLALGSQLGLSEELLEEIEQMSHLHDIGKIAMPESLFAKPGPLTEMEWALMRNHPEIGFRIVALMQDYAHLAQSILSHHEWYDGSGYPRGLKGREIPLAARILALAEAVTVMREGASYKGPMALPEVVLELRRCQGTQFDPELTDLMVGILETEHTAPAERGIMGGQASTTQSEE